ncbi:hypothetical protein LINPERPRIM_LOCUS1486, partial [Linum perenne]
SFADEVKIGARMVIQDNADRLLHYRTSCWNKCWNSMKAECKELLKALSWMEDLGMRKVNFQSDAKQVVVDVINKRTEMRTELGDLTRSCITILTRNPYFEVSFIERDHNRVAHSLARHSIILTTPCVGVISLEWLIDALDRHSQQTIRDLLNQIPRKLHSNLLHLQFVTSLERIISKTSMAEKAVEAYWLMEDFDDSMWLYRLKVLSLLE